MSLNRIKSQLLMRLLLKAAWVRKDRAFTALISVAVVATIATSVLTIYSDLEGKLSREFRGFGRIDGIAKLWRPEQRRTSRINTIAAGGEVVPVAYAIGTATGNGTKMVVGGADLDKLRRLNSSWAFSNRKTGAALIGSRVDETLAHGAAFQISFGQSNATIQPGQLFHSGSEDDSRVYLPLEDFTRLTGVRANTALVRVEGKSQEIQNAIDRLRASLPDAEVQPVRRITQAQTAVVGKTRSVVLAASVVVLVLIMLCMVATFTSSVLERRRDFAVMKALGASDRTVNFLFAGESSMLALAGAAAGYILGSGVAFWIGKANFAAAILPQPALLLPVLAGSIVLALIASTAPLRLLRHIQPAAILRGE